MFFGVAKYADNRIGRRMINELLENNLTRLKIIKSKVKTQNPQKIKINVFRNHAFETMEALINVFLSYSNIEADFWYSDYDDSFNFNVQQSDINILWIDVTRYKNINFAEWQQNRISVLKQESSAKILVYLSEKTDDNVLKIPDVIVADSCVVKSLLNNEFYEEADMITHTGTPLSSKSLLYIARELGFKYIPSLVKPSLKAVITDLDNTFYDGILGEDGINGIKPRYEFQRKLKMLKEHGIMLGISSKNEEKDVIELFEKRSDFILKLEDFTSYSVNWNSKSDGIMKIVKQMNIGFESVLFVDDNIGEIEWVKSQIPDINILLASDINIVNSIDLYPGLFKSSVLKEDSIRTKDIKANELRENLFNKDEDEYFKQLQMVITYSINPFDKKERVVELINKTNQFIFSYKRYLHDSISEYFSDYDKAVMTIELQDKLSDSGVIGIITARNENSILKIDEICVSCRALGRHIEDYMLAKAFLILKNYLKCSDKIKFDFVEGPRNKPAQVWLEKYSNLKVGCKAEIEMPLQQNIKENKFVQTNVREYDYTV